jgi:hypothetical protein
MTWFKIDMSILEDKKVGICAKTVVFAPARTQMFFCQVNPKMNFGDVFQKFIFGRHQ